ncbi:MAG: type II secretion system protein [bacterium]
MRRKHGVTVIEVMMVIVALVIVAAFLYPVIARYREARRGRNTSCSSQQRQIEASLQMYVQDHSNIFPLSSTVWANVKVDPDVLICPKAKTLLNGFLYNNKLSVLNIDKIDDPTKIFVTVDGETIYNEHIYISQTNICYRHSDTAIASFADGHVSYVSKNDVKLPWDLPVEKPVVKKKGVKHEKK